MPNMHTDDITRVPFNTYRFIIYIYASAMQYNMPCTEIKRKYLIFPTKCFNHYAHQPCH